MIIAIGTRKGLWMARRSNGEWSVDGPSFPMSEVPSLAWVSHADEDPTLLAGTMSPHWGPSVASSTDLGVTWHEVEGGSMHFEPDDGASLERVWQLQADPLAEGVVWAGCEPTSLWRSEDGGQKFSLIRSLWDHPHRPHWAPGFGGAAVHTIVPRAGASTVIAMSTGGVYRSDDEASSWRPTNTGISARFNPDPYPEYGQCVHKVAADAQEPLRLFAQNHHGVYRSDDDGITWTSIADGLPSDFGFVMVAHPTRAGSVWVVPIEADLRRLPPGGQLRVWRTDDAGETWRANESGLPDDCWTVVLRDAADAVAEPGSEVAAVAIGTRDGCVYVSEDDGATFTQVAAHLPDVLCVRMSTA
jgi:photosystem II stability/assembly factor-like uncharacterized protein